MTDHKTDAPVLSKFTKVDQIGIVVRNMEDKLKDFKKIFGIEPITIMESSRESASIKTGFLYLGEVQIELIQIISGETLHSKFLEEKGEGIHHLAFFVDDLEKELTELEKEGIKVLDRGTVQGIIKFAYLDTEEALGVILELIQTTI
ncbi:MAG: VOC family protein [Candidatus Hodarchaeota archaeon]